jgi:hypothetical protein
VHDQCWRLGLHVPACCPEARPMLEAGTSYARLLPKGQTNAGGWDFTAQRPDQCWRLGLHMFACCPEASPMLEAGNLIGSLAAQRPDQAMCQSAPASTFRFLANAAKGKSSRMCFCAGVCFASLPFTGSRDKLGNNGRGIN